MELFSRTEREGWTMWGNQAGLLAAEDEAHAYGDRPFENEEYKLGDTASAQLRLEILEKSGRRKR